MVEVSLNEDEVRTFALDEVNLVRFRALDGDDVFVNDTDINATAVRSRWQRPIIGGGGHNRFQGGKGDDILGGGDRNDSLRGREGNDLILGGRRHDRLFGGEGDDEIRGQHGRDRINGDAGDDLIIGGNDNDRINGGDGDDSLNGNNGRDRIFGGDGDDFLRGGDGDDILIGDQGDDMIRGLSGNDNLQGGDGDDELKGGADSDSLIGGFIGSDDLTGGTGFDRFLITKDDNVIDADSNDVRFEFVNQGSLLDGGFWVDDYIAVVDDAFARIADQTGNNRLFSSGTENEGIRVVKGNNIDPGNSVDDGTRTIAINDWDPGDDSANDAAIRQIFVQLAKSFDSVDEINAVFPNEGDRFESFLAVSEWTEGDNVPAGFEPSTDGEWYYRVGTEFVDDRGRANPSEDWSTVWELFLNPDAADADRDRLSIKLEHIDEFFEMASSN